METRANYVLIGAFALAGFLGIFAFFLWFANIQLDRQFAYYDIDFPTVSGLTEASDVRFSGLPVGQVVDVRLSPNRDGKVRVRVEVEAATPVRTDSIATIEAQGVTGVSYVGISAGTTSSPLLTEASTSQVPMIEAGQSVLQSLSQDAPEILAQTLAAVRDLRELLGDENQKRVQTILINVEDATASFSEALDEFSTISKTISVFASEIGRFNTSLDALATDASGAFDAVETTLAGIDDVVSDAKTLLAEGTTTITQAQKTLTTAETYISDDLGPATELAGSTVADLGTRVVALGDRADALMTTLSGTGEEATRRLSEMQTTLASTDALIARMDGTFTSVDNAAQRFDGLIADGGVKLIAELRTATADATSVIEKIGNAAENDLPAILSDIRNASETASRVVTTVGQDLSSASGQLDALARNASETLGDARVTFANANETLSSINAALDTGDRALRAAERAFNGADRVMNEDLHEITERLRTTLDQLGAAIGQVADDIPGVTEDLRAASRSAESAFAQIESAVGQSAPAFRDFSTISLPQYGRLAVETRTLIDNLDKLVEQMRRDPSRFFLSPRAPEYRR